MYSSSGSGWTLSRTLVDPGTNFGDNFGYSVAVSGATAVVTASDVAYVYTAGLGRPWTRSAILKNPAGVTENFGWDASLDGNTAVIGAPPAHAGSDQGAAYVFVRSGSKWRIQARLASPGFLTNDNFGYAVAISGNRILVGAPSGGRHSSGIAYEYLRSKSNWRQKQTIKDPQDVPGDQFGSSVSVSGTTGIIGSPGQNHAYLKLKLT